MEAEFYEGRRMSYGGALCTVRFAGEVAGTRGKWLGVEWDDPTRGKHAGVHNGVTYFRCASSHPTAGSFVRPDRPADPQHTFKEAIRNKYASDLVPQSDAAGSTTEAVRISGKEVKEIGFEKVKRQLANLFELKIVILDRLCLARPSARAASLTGGYGSFALDSTDVEDTSPKILDLDLSRNLLEQWDEVFDIIRQLKQLKSLRVDGNRFRVTLSTRLDPKVLPTLKTLSLSNTLLSWKDICALPNFFASLDSLSANENEYRTLVNAPQLSVLTSIDLEGNEFVSLEDIASLVTLPKLKRINLKGNRICTSYEDQSSGSRAALSFSPNVEEVDLSYNQIADWSFINSFNHVFPGMTTLRVSHNPLYENLKAVDGRQLTADDGYMLTLARLGDLKRLNFSNISDKERLNAETYYLSQIVAELTKLPESEEHRILSQHPRYKELSEVYGGRTITRDVKAVESEDSLAKRLLNCIFEPDESILKMTGASPTDRSSTSIALELPRTFTVYNTLGIVGRLLKVKPMLLRLVWMTEEQERTAGPSLDDDDNLDDPDSAPKFREELLMPKTRGLGTWVDGSSARFRVEVSEEDVKRNNYAHGLE